MELVILQYIKFTVHLTYFLLVCLFVFRLSFSVTVKKLPEFNLFFIQLRNKIKNVNYILTLKNE